MVRLTRFVLMLAAGFGVSLAAPGGCDAGVIPWVYDAIFGPVGSMRVARGYGQTYAGYTPYYANYASYDSPGYGSYGAAYAPSYSGYGYSSAGSCCNQTTQYAPAIGYEQSYGNTQSFYGSPAVYGNPGCSSCPSGNCNSGMNCSNCTVNSTPTTSGYGSTGVSGPTPDPNYNSRDNSRDLNHRLNELEHRLNEDERFLKNKHGEDYSPRTYSPTTYPREKSEIVPKRKTDSFGSNPSDIDFPPPRRRPAPQDEIDEQDTKKPIITPPGTGEGNSNETKDGETPTIKEAEPLGSRLNNRLTSRAIAPRERQQIVTNQARAALAKSNGSPAKNQQSAPRTAELARQ